MRQFIDEDIAPTLDPPPGVSVAAYGDEVLARFANPAIVHRTVQVAMDGSQKLPQRVLHTIAYSLGLQPWRSILFGIADVALWVTTISLLIASVRA